MKDFDVQRKPFVVPVDDGKLIEEHFGLASIDSDLSLAHMIAPAGWGEPFQTPEFEEYTYIIRGKKKIEVGEEVVDSFTWGIHSHQKRCEGSLQQSVRTALRVSRHLHTSFQNRNGAQGRRIA